jgi:uncharacterized Zn finger protein
MKNKKLNKCPKCGNDGYPEFLRNEELGYKVWCGVCEEVETEWFNTKDEARNNWNFEIA